MSVPDLLPNIAQAGADPLSSTSDGQSATARSAQDLIALDRYQKAAAAASLTRRGLRFSKLIPAGPASDQGTAAIGGITFDSPGGIV